MEVFDTLYAFSCTAYLVTPLDLVTFFWQTKSVTKSGLHCTLWEDLHSKFQIGVFCSIVIGQGLLYNLSGQKGTQANLKGWKFSNYSLTFGSFYGLKWWKFSFTLWEEISKEGKNEEISVVRMHAD